MSNSELRQKIKEIIAEMDLGENKAEKIIPIEASGRHVHLSRKDVDRLFGEDYELSPCRELSQPGQYLAEEKVRLIGPKGIIERAAILGPPRSDTQVELSKTDAVKLGIDPPLRFSGNVEGSASIFIGSAKDIVKLEEGVIIAKNHIHMQPQDAQRLGVEDGEKVNVEAMTERSIIFKKVLIRVNEAYRLSMHIDYDEANACMHRPGDKGKIIKLD
ncbi:phosphate propanoyltransferase [Halanaerobium sp. Z-7514]|uniref:Phosphate propanoyltransferase n=1 Tax=Halanaerobium polyolivorans TaxID=2886943 RepID=A0AAW4WST6_9FIRM|nr:phosphate propanoyltransferase [Halanaerobium polyolivorans]MCC3144160.1 phosphate propanoyltransferase [Halanaerobium polyolivorans]RQD74513.1 MAG: phosphate propanoyltransferase [Halanaerobium sp. MSAO_Bac5]